MSRVILCLELSESNSCLDFFYLVVLYEVCFVFVFTFFRFFCLFLKTFLSTQHSHMGPKQIVPLLVRVDMGVIELKCTPKYTELTSSDAVSCYILDIQLSISFYFIYLFIFGCKVLFLF